jgi:hypothetical protein
LVNRIPACLCVVAVVAIGGACQQRAENSEAKAAAARQAKLTKTWPVPNAAPNEAERFWTLQNGYLVLWEPDASTPPPIPGRSLLSLSCKSGSILAVEPDIIIQQDLPLPVPPFDVLSLEAGPLRLNTAIRRVSNGYTTWAAGDFKIAKAAVRQVLDAPFIVIRPLYLGDHPDLYPAEDYGERYSAPPVALRDAFLSGCSMS